MFVVGFIDFGLLRFVKMYDCGIADEVAPFFIRCFSYLKYSW